jgi:CO/xanthine dehydrogenase Mo-binding subunit
VSFAYEMQMEKIAADLGLDPIEVRRRNMLQEGDITATGQKLTWSVGSEEVFEQTLAHSKFVERRAELASQSKSNHVRRGVGLSFFFHGAGFTGSGEARMKAQAAIEITPEGRVQVLSGSTEIGQGTVTIFCQIVGDELGLPYDAIEVVDPDTSRVPDSGPTVASRTCMIVGRVLQLAAKELKDKLTHFVAERHRTNEVTIEHGFFTAGGNKLMEFGEAATAYQEARGKLRADVKYSPPPGVVWDDDTYSGDAYPAFSWGAEVVEVEVDLDTYETRVIKITTAQDVGRAINPLLAAGQIEGGTLQAVGYGLFEDVIWKDGRVVNNRMTNYIIPTSLDAPEIETILVEKEYPYGPFGAKGLGELPMDGTAPAIAAAVLNATGAFVSEIPVTPERLMVALEGSAKRG